MPVSAATLRGFVPAADPIAPRSTQARPGPGFGRRLLEAVIAWRMQQARAVVARHAHLLPRPSDVPSRKG